MEFVIITGLSGAGKGRVKSIMADLGYYCVDNLPVELLGAAIEMAKADSARFGRMAFVLDARSNRDFGQLTEKLEDMAMRDISVRILYLEAREEYIVKRYKETRRRHPLDGEYPELARAIGAERELLEPLRRRADTIIDTTGLSANQLTEKLAPIFGHEGKSPVMATEVRTFGFKNGIPPDADMVFDVRFLPNPFYIAELKPLTGLDAPVSEYVMRFPEAQRFLRVLCELLEFLLPQYQAEGRQKLVIAIGCTGGRHRSVTLAERTGEFLKRGGWRHEVLHREIG
jgi:UPF0042 nucleotide-binding protein